MYLVLIRRLIKPAVIGAAIVGSVWGVLVRSRIELMVSPRAAVPTKPQHLNVFVPPSHRNNKIMRA